MGRPALLIIDMQNDFVLEGKPMRVAGAGEVIPKIQAVLYEFRRRSLPVFHILRVHRQDGSDVEIIRQDLFRMNPFAVAGTYGAAVVEELAPVPGGICPHQNPDECVYRNGARPDTPHS